MLKKICASSSIKRNRSTIGVPILSDAQYTRLKGLLNNTLSIAKKDANETETLSVFALLQSIIQNLNDTISNLSINGIKPKISIYLTGSSTSYILGNTERHPMEKDIDFTVFIEGEATENLYDLIYSALRKGKTTGPLSWKSTYMQDAEAKEKRFSIFQFYPEGFHPIEVKVCDTEEIALREKFPSHDMHFELSPLFQVPQMSKRILVHAENAKLTELLNEARLIMIPNKAAIEARANRMDRASMYLRYLKARETKPMLISKASIRKLESMFLSAAQSTETELSESHHSPCHSMLLIISFLERSLKDNTAELTFKHACTLRALFESSKAKECLSEESIYEYVSICKLMQRLAAEKKTSTQEVKSNSYLLFIELQRLYKNSNRNKISEKSRIKERLDQINQQLAADYTELFMGSRQSVALAHLEALERFCVNEDAFTDAVGNGEESTWNDSLIRELTGYVSNSTAWAASGECNEEEFLAYEMRINTLLRNKKSSLYKLIKAKFKEAKGDQSKQLIVQATLIPLSNRGKEYEKQIKELIDRGSTWTEFIEKINDLITESLVKDTLVTACVNYFIEIRQKKAKAIAKELSNCDQAFSNAIARTAIQKDCSVRIQGLRQYWTEMQAAPFKLEKGDSDTIVKALVDSEAHLSQILIKINAEEVHIEEELVNESKNRANEMLDAITSIRKAAAKHTQAKEKNKVFKESFKQDMRSTLAWTKNEEENKKIEQECISSIAENGVDHDLVEQIKDGAELDEFMTGLSEQAAMENDLQRNVSNWLSTTPAPWIREIDSDVSMADKIQDGPEELYFREGHWEAFEKEKDLFPNNVHHLIQRPIRIDQYLSMLLGICQSIVDPKNASDGLTEPRVKALMGLIEYGQVLPENTWISLIRAYALHYDKESAIKEKKKAIADLDEKNDFSSLNKDSDTTAKLLLLEALVRTELTLKNEAYVVGKSSDFNEIRDACNRDKALTVAQKNQLLRNYGILVLSREFIRETDHPLGLMNEAGLCKSRQRMLSNLQGNLQIIAPRNTALEIAVLKQIKENLKKAIECKKKMESCSKDAEFIRLWSSEIFKKLRENHKGTAAEFFMTLADYITVLYPALMKKVIADEELAYWRQRADELRKSDENALFLWREISRYLNEEELISPESLHRELRNCPDSVKQNPQLSIALMQMHFKYSTLVLEFDDLQLEQLEYFGSEILNHPLLIETRSDVIFTHLLRAESIAIAQKSELSESMTAVKNRVKSDKELNLRFQKYVVAQIRTMSMTYTKDAYSKLEAGVARDMNSLLQAKMSLENEHALHTKYMERLLAEPCDDTKLSEDLQRLEKDRKHFQLCIQCYELINSVNNLAGITFAERDDFIRITHPVAKNIKKVLSNFRIELAANSLILGIVAMSYAVFLNIIDKNLNPLRHDCCYIPHDLQTIISRMQIAYDGFSGNGKIIEARGISNQQIVFLRIQELMRFTENERSLLQCGLRHLYPNFLFFSRILAFANKIDVKSLAVLILDQGAMTWSNFEEEVQTDLKEIKELSQKKANPELKTLYRIYRTLSELNHIYITYFFFATNIDKRFLKRLESLFLTNWKDLNISSPGKSLLALPTKALIADFGDELTDASVSLAKIDEYMHEWAKQFNIKPGKQAWSNALKSTRNHCIELAPGKHSLQALSTAMTASRCIDTRFLDLETSYRKEVLEHTAAATKHWKTYFSSNTNPVKIIKEACMVYGTLQCCKNLRETPETTAFKEQLARQAVDTVKKIKAKIDSTEETGKNQRLYEAYCILRFLCNSHAFLEGQRKEVIIILLQAFNSVLSDPLSIKEFEEKYNLAHMRVLYYLNSVLDIDDEMMVTL